jgi:hypothetical protein
LWLTREQIGRFSPICPGQAAEQSETPAAHLYESLEEQFAYGLDRILDGLGIARDFPAPADP